VPSLPMTITAWGGLDGRVWHEASSIELVELGAAARSLRGEPLGSEGGGADLDEDR